MASHKPEGAVWRWFAVAPKKTVTVVEAGIADSGLAFNASQSIRFTAANRRSL